MSAIGVNTTCRTNVRFGSRVPGRGFPKPATGINGRFLGSRPLAIRLQAATTGRDRHGHGDSITDNET